MNISLDDNSGIVGDAPSLKADQDEGETSQSLFVHLALLFITSHVSKVLTRNFQMSQFHTL